ncbi:hypothetical protein JCGZ_10888 [Jatropha curcas]|uniref:Uncharacterized protein n=1 Tax=Jatropha curcas TaxID=180498 RepID=A0A067KI64_JATCU|nr:hypothetical protein JCGZ_10888 [Jatropha curcas]
MHQNHSSLKRVIVRNGSIYSSQCSNESNKRNPYSYNQETDNAYLINLFEKLPTEKQETVIKQLIKEIPGISIQKFSNEKEEDYRLRCFAQLIVKLPNDGFFKKKFDCLHILVEVSQQRQRPIDRKLKPVSSRDSFAISTRSCCASFTSAHSHDYQESNLKLQLFKVKSFDLRGGGKAGGGGGGVDGSSTNSTSGTSSKG